MDKFMSLMFYQIADLYLSILSSLKSVKNFKTKWLHSGAQNNLPMMPEETNNAYRQKTHLFNMQEEESATIQTVR